MTERQKQIELLLRRTILHFNKKRTVFIEESFM